MVECIHCGREMHKICVLYHENIWTDGFQCENCLKAKHIMLKENKFSAKRKLTEFITIYAVVILFTSLLYSLPLLPLLPPLPLSFLPPLPLSPSFLPPLPLFCLTCFLFFPFLSPPSLNHRPPNHQTSTVP